MKCLEIIEIRATHNKNKLMELELRKIVREFKAEPGVLAVNAFSKSMIDSDFSIHICHDTEIDNSGSSLGIRFASAFKDFGLVKHSVWMVMNRFSDF